MRQQTTRIRDHASNEERRFRRRGNNGQSTPTIVPTKMRPRDNYLVRHDSADADEQKRRDYFGGRLTHQEYYLWVAQEIGLQALRAVLLNHFDAAELRRAWTRDDYSDTDRRNLNALPIARWDSLHALVTIWAARARFVVWSLSDTVCVMKAVARHLLESNEL